MKLLITRNNYNLAADTLLNFSRVYPNAWWDQQRTNLTPELSAAYNTLQAVTNAWICGEPPIARDVTDEQFQAAIELLNSVEEPQ